MCLAAVLSVCSVQPARAIAFSFTTVAGDTLTAAQAGAFRAAADSWSSVLRDDFTVNLQIGFRALGGLVLGQTMAQLLSGPALDVVGLLAADAKSATDASAVAALTSGPSMAALAGGVLVVTRAQGKALGAGLSGLDGTIEFSTSVTFSTQRDAGGGVAAGTFDLVGIAEHEIGHVLGFTSGVDGGGMTLLDAFRYRASGVRSLVAGESAYLSIDGGVTSLASFSVGGAGNAQASHFLQGTGAVLDPYFSAGEVRSIGAVDVRALDAIGYDVPEPPGVVLLLLGTVVLGVWRGCCPRPVAAAGSRPRSN